MYDAEWTAPVTIEFSARRVTVIVRTTRDATECLLEVWPDDFRGLEWDSALAICLEVYENGEDPEKARRAFLTAAGAIASGARVRIAEKAARK